MLRIIIFKLLAYAIHEKGHPIDIQGHRNMLGC